MIKSSQSTTVLVALIFVLVAICSLAHADYVQSESLPVDADSPIVKRPFCNSFTGCGRKRSADVDTDPEAFLQKFRQQIMRQARLQGLQSRLDSLSDKRNFKNHLLGPYFDYVEDRKKRMAPNYADNKYDIEDGSDAIYIH